MRRCAFITGGSGFLGSFVVRDLLDAGFERIYVLMRGESPEACARRLRALWWERPELASEIEQRVFPVCGDIRNEQLGMPAREYETLAREVTHIVHAAAEIGVNETAEVFARVNVTGTLNALLFASAAQRAGALQHFVHVSTAYVAGTREGNVAEDELVATTFNSLYEQSKFGAEQLVCDCFGTFPASIVRPAQIVGDSATGFVATFNTLYYPLKLYLKGKLPVIPVSAQQQVNMVPVDYVARVIVRVLLNPDAAGKTFHATIPQSHQPTAGDLLAFVRAWSRENLRCDPGSPIFLSVPFAARLGRTRNLAASSAPKPKNLLQNMLALAPYFSENRSYDTANTERLIGAEYPDWRDYLPRLLAYATRKGFLNHTGRTVFEQMLVRLGSKRHSLTYYDVSADGMKATSAADAKHAILKAAAALRACGIEPQDRVAIVGVNSTRYLIADAAIGLVGAVSVPLYYTSPASDIVELSRTSNAKLVFVGTRALAQALVGMLDIPMVSLLEDDAPEALVSWDEFLAKAPEPVQEPAYAPAPDAAATIRCTSGTTGTPKGVLFDQYQLRWMGEVMPSLLDWRTRNGKLRYLSFLPMSHVVEGILVAYAPYYILSDIEFYYLNDFSALERALPQVRPTLFFSVPRFYEKVWNQFASTGAGRFWIGLPAGTAKHLLSHPLRHVLLRRAGLDKCRQLLVGSAPISMDLLESFRELGVEIHNAFGVTEAPLITLTRLGENELGSVGTLLPDTQAKIGDDGLVYVRGPQVTRGYDGATGPATDEDGWFCTGDFASWSEAGNLVLNGRAKEVLVTSYGKNISPQRIEVLLKGIDGVSEAVAVADGKPFTTALLWLEADVADSMDWQTFDDAVKDANERLSHPEQVKRWIVAEKPLSIATGELTPNLKVRRNIVAQTRSHLVEQLYNGWEQARSGVADDSLHCGEAGAQ